MSLKQNHWHKISILKFIRSTSCLKPKLLSREYHRAAHKWIGFLLLQPYIFNLLVSLDVHNIPRSYENSINQIKLTSRWIEATITKEVRALGIVATIMHLSKILSNIWLMTPLEISFREPMAILKLYSSKFSSTVL